MNILHRLRFARGSEALDFVRALRESSEAQLRADLFGIGPVLVYGALILAPDAPAELYASFGALTLAHALGVVGGSGGGGGGGGTARASLALELPADMALLFTASMPDESILVRGL